MTITIDSAGNVSPGLTVPVLNSTTINSNSVTLTGSVIQQFAGRIRLLTPVGGALVREWADSIAATSGNIEIGVSYNADLNPTTGVWAGRDKTDICWLEKWSDVGGVKEFWSAPSAAAGVAPVWSRTYALNSTTGNLSLGNTTAVSTATPLTVSLGGTYGSGVAGATANLKLKVYDTGVATYGIGVSVGALEYQVATGITHNFYVQNVLYSQVRDAGGFYSKNGFATSVSAEVAAATYTVTDNDADLYINFAGTVTLTLPAAASYAGRYLSIRTYQAQLVNSASANVSVNGVVGSAILAAVAGKWATLKSDGTNWEVLLNN